MHPDPDDAAVLHATSIYAIPRWAALTPFGRAYARRRIARLVARHMTGQGYQAIGPECYHFATVDGRSVLVVHVRVRDAIAAAYADEADR